MQLTYSMRPQGNIYNGLLQLVNTLTDINEMVEIGSYAGESTSIFAAKGFRVHAIDPWSNGYDEGDLASHIQPMNEIETLFDQVCSKYPNITKHKMTSLEGSKLFEDESLDFVYIDGLHTYEGVRNDIIAWLPKIKKGLWIGGHDYREFDNPAVKKAVDELIKVEQVFEDSSYLVRVL